MEEQKLQTLPVVSCQHYANPNNIETLLNHCDMCHKYDKCYPKGVCVAKQPSRKSNKILGKLAQLFR